MAKQSEIKIIIEAVDKASKELGKIGTALGSLGNAAGVAAGVVVGALAGISAAAWSLAKDAAPVEGIKSAFEGMTASIEGGSDGMLSAMEEASYGMIKQSDLMQTWNLAAQLVSKDFAQELPDAMRYLSKISAATGEDLSFLTDSLVRGIGRLSPMILDNLGIQVDLTAAYEEYAQANGLVVDSLTKTQQQAALTNAVMEALAANTADMPDIAGTFAQSWATVQAQFANLKEEIGLKLLPLFSTIAEKITELFQKPEVQAGIDGLLDGLGKIIGHEDSGIIGVVYALSTGDIPGALEMAFGAESSQKILDFAALFKPTGAEARTFGEELQGTIANIRIAIAKMRVAATEIAMIVTVLFEGTENNVDLLSIRVQNDINNILGKINSMISAINKLPGINIGLLEIPAITVPYPEALLAVASTEAYSNYQEALHALEQLQANPTGKQQGGYADTGFASGGSFIVPGAGTGDRPYTMGLEPGERVAVTPRGSLSGGEMLALTININTPVNLADRTFVERELAPIVRSTVRQVLAGA